MNTRLSLAGTVVMMIGAWLAPFGRTAGLELHGNPDELASHLAGLPKITSIAGHASKEFQADQAVVSLSVVTEDKSLGDALDQNLKLRRNLIQALTKRGLVKERIKSSKFSSIPEHGKFSGKVRQYKVENQVRITIESEEEFLAVAEQVDQEERLQFQRLEMEDPQKSAREMSILGDAFDQILAKKKMLEEKFGVTLVPKQVAQPEIAEVQIGVQSGSAPSFLRTTPLPERGRSTIALHALAQRFEEGSGFGQVRYAAHVEVQFETVWKPK